MTCSTNNTEYARKKAETIRERERCEAEKRARKDADRKRVADAIEANYNAWMAREKSRMDKDVAKAEAAGAADEAARRQRAKDSQANMNATNRAMLQAKADAKSQARAAEAGYAEEWALRVKELKQEVSWGPL